MSATREQHWQDATGCSTPADANRRLLEQTEQLRQKDEVIRELADALEATQLGHDLRRGPCWCRTMPHAGYCETRRSALRLAGRRP